MFYIISMSFVFVILVILSLEKNEVIHNYLFANPINIVFNKSCVKENTER
jgi:hypothetical protein